MTSRTCSARCSRPRPKGWAFVLDRRINDNYVGPTFAKLLRPWLDELEGPLLARHLLGGIVLEDLPAGMITPLMRDVLSSNEFELCARCPTRSFSATRPAGSTTASRSTRCSGRPVSRRCSISARSTNSTRCSPRTSSRSGGATATRIGAIPAWSEVLLVDRAVLIDSKSHHSGAIIQSTGVAITPKPAIMLPLMT